MKRRLNIACGVLHRPRIVLLDEPTVGVDPQSRDRIYDMLADLAAEGVSLLADHASPRGSRGALLAHGDHRSRPRHRGRDARASSWTGRSAGSGSSRCASTRRWPACPAWPAVTDARLDPDDATRLRAKLTDVAAELPALLARVRDAGRAVEDVDVRGPSLQSVFIHLTGRELRE